MTKTLSTFAPIPGQSALWSATAGTLRCTALRLRDTTLCLYSPVLGLAEAASISLKALGEVSFLLAPNHYHNKGLREYAQAFPDAALICSDKARPRLEKQTGLSFGGLDRLTSQLPDDLKLALPDGLKTGEVWLTSDMSEDHAWIVCDAFKGPSGKSDNISSHIEMLGTFPTYGIKDRATYLGWVKTKLKAKTPKMVVPCHGTIVRSGHLCSDMLCLLSREID
ncbi:MAG: hypothetical protein AAGK77_13295 [Pseudomonadota bacterium]